jgi:hypothetical protein
MVLRHAVQVIAAAGALLLQREVPEHVNIKAAQVGAFCNQALKQRPWDSADTPPPVASRPHKPPHTSAPACRRCKVAAAAGVPVLLDAGGVDAPLSDALLRCLTLISPNETELQRLTGGQPAETVAQVVSAAGQLQQQALAAAAAAGASQAPQPQQQLSVLVKRGTAGSLLVPPGGSPVTQQAAIPAAKVVDTTGELTRGCACTQRPTPGRDAHMSGPCRPCVTLPLLLLQALATATQLPT